MLDRTLVRQVSQQGEWNGIPVAMSKGIAALVNGTVTVLATAPLTVTPGTFYDLRLDAVGNELRAFVNNKQVLQATDASHTSGQGGMLMYKTSAEYRDYLSWQP